MERYRSIIPDFQKFLEVIQTPEPVYIRINTLKVDDVSSIRDYMLALGYELISVDGLPWHYRVEGKKDPQLVARTIPHWSGLFYIQDAASGVVAHILNPLPESTVLDLCAAPGGKTTQMAQLMNNTGLIYANDIGTKRLRSLQTNLLRMGVVNTVVVRFNGVQFPEVNPSPDFVLVDAPCSGEGRVRESVRLRQGAELGFIKEISGLQKGLLRRAISIAKKGALIAYSTCTFAPEENEMVVEYVLEREPVEIVPVELKSIPHSPGITRWEGKQLHKDLEACIRIYPHQMNSGGMFIALLRKV